MRTSERTASPAYGVDLLRSFIGTVRWPAPTFTHARVAREDGRRYRLAGQIHAAARSGSVHVCKDASPLAQAKHVKNLMNFRSSTLEPFEI